ncbi:hypothetical protein [Sinorhizobium meliloti]|uniref:hypothetical protein n=1 Tax=Rhizobium meliloti TaxID=382 RepID=UPI000FDB6B81|nr:hypothetical protein [Sinorhizobium meliloti]RVG82209.1 hypothetical protein CN219_22575 [Sinorhizobium meliloti]RVI33389.1 hypothetical protein CN197_17980 [Sinorhizobium meliloti]RVI46553.1 hypothetical protein CN196_09625 [Sinorhizobium meliloti]RVJ25812.1 hypothetical protein CN177_13055 [Sinorhizobium meliloti]RVK00657.1 hypothetical protein CN170_12605 [Sinorhizobium meliloti]
MVRSKSSTVSTFVSEVGSSCLSGPRLRKVDLLGMIAGLESVTAGVLRIDRRVVNQVERRAREIAMVFQGVMWNAALLGHHPLHHSCVQR